MDKFNFDAIVIGGGIIGLTSAVSLQSSGKSVLLLEKNKSLFDETSSRNSGVIHAGIYYSKSPNKEFHCLRGKNLLYEFCHKFNVPHKNCGKFILGQEHNLRKMEDLKQHSDVISKDNLLWSSEKKFKANYPGFSCDHVLFSPTSGIVSIPDLSLTLEKVFLDSGGIISVNSEALEIIPEKKDAIEVLVSSKDKFLCTSSFVVNAAGLNCANFIEEYEVKFCKGNYFTCPKLKLDKLIYPIEQDENGLGIHITLDMDGNVKFGPDIEWVDTIDYSIDQKLEEKFLHYILKYFPDIEKYTIHPDYSGIRPKIFSRKSQIKDFVFHKEQYTESMIFHCLGIESPGITSSFSIAKMIGEEFNALVN